MIKRYHDTIAAADTTMMAASATVSGLNAHLHVEMRPICVGQTVTGAPTSRHW